MPGDSTRRFSSGGVPRLSESHAQRARGPKRSVQVLLDPPSPPAMDGPLCLCAPTTSARPIGRETSRQQMAYGPFSFFSSSSTHCDTANTRWPHDAEQCGARMKQKRPDVRHPLPGAPPLAARSGDGATGSDRRRGLYFPNTTGRWVGRESAPKMIGRRGAQLDPPHLSFWGPATRTHVFL
jgi:hypothetical protein